MSSCSTSTTVASNTFSNQFKANTMLMRALLQVLQAMQSRTWDRNLSKLANDLLIELLGGCISLAGAKAKMTDSTDGRVQASQMHIAESITWKSHLDMNNTHSSF